MARKLTISVVEDLSDDDYAHLANALWMFMRNTPYDFQVTPDGKTPAKTLNAAWRQYGEDAGWE